MHKVAESVRLLVVCCAVLSGCGDQPAPLPEVPGTLLRFSLSQEAASRPSAKRVDAERTRLADGVRALIEKRIDSYLPGTTVTTNGKDEVNVRIPSTNSDDILGTTRCVTRIGTLRFRIEVRPDEDYVANAARDGRKEDLKRRRVWPRGDRASFEEFLLKEIAIWKGARVSKRPYVPSSSRFELVKERGTDGASRHHFHLLEVPTLDSNEHFDSGILTNPRISYDLAGRPVIDVDIRNEHQLAFGQWTERNLLLPMAIVFNDEFFNAPWIYARLGTMLRLSLGAAPRAQVEMEAKMLVAALSSGPLLTLRSTERVASVR